MAGLFACGALLLIAIAGMEGWRACALGLGMESARPLIEAIGLLSAWGLFIALNRRAEELEPEAMEEAKREDEKMR